MDDKRFDGFDAQKFGFSSIEFFLNPVKTSGFSGAWGDDESKITAMQLFLVLEKGDHGSWLLLQPDNSVDSAYHASTSAEGLFFVQPGVNAAAMNPVHPSPQRRRPAAGTQ
jgi:hypothetical protein